MAELPVRYVMAHGGSVAHFVKSAVYRPGGYSEAICGFQPRYPWAWSGLQRPNCASCPACLSRSQFYEVPGGR